MFILTIETCDSQRLVGTFDVDHARTERDSSHPCAQNLPSLLLHPLGTVLSVHVLDLVPEFPNKGDRIAPADPDISGPVFL